MGRKGWGFGLRVGVMVDPVAAGSSRRAGAFGWDGAHGTDGWVDPLQGLAAVYFVQQSTKPPLHAFERAIAPPSRPDRRLPLVSNGGDITA